MANGDGFMSDMSKFVSLLVVVVGATAAILTQGFLSTRAIETHIIRADNRFEKMEEKMRAFPPGTGRDRWTATDEIEVWREFKDRNGAIEVPDPKEIVRERLMREYNLPALGQRRGG